MIEKIIMGCLFNLLNIHTIPERMDLLKVFVESYHSYRDKWSGDGEVEMDAFTLGYKDMIIYRDEKYKN